MKSNPGNGARLGPYHRLVRAWLAVTRRKVRVLHTADFAKEGPVLFAVSYPAGLLPAAVWAVAMERPVHCLLPAHLLRGGVAQLLGRCLGCIPYEHDVADADTAQRDAAGVLAGGGALVVLAERTNESLASAVAALAWRAEAQQPGGRIALHPVHLFLPDSASSSREILIYVDQAMDRPPDWPSVHSQESDTQTLAAALEARLQENAFQLRPRDLGYLLGDLEEVLRSSLREEWASRPEWKQDTDGFVLSGRVVENIRQANYLNPARLVAARQSLDEYRRLERQCKLRELQMTMGDSRLESGGRRALVWFEVVLGAPIALYGLLNHLAIILVLYLARAFKHGTSRPSSTRWVIRGGVTLAFYALQICLVTHWRGRAAAGYYAPALPISGAYLWRYMELVRPRAHRLFISLTIPGLKRKIQRQRCALLSEFDRTLADYEEKTAVAQ